jgi:hypothetical protein
MTEGLDSFFTPKHKQLDRIARAINILSWLALAFYLLYAILKIFENIRFQGDITFVELLKIAPEAVLNDWLNVLDTIFVGIIFWLVLRSISVGLNMIVETDLNYREKMWGGNDGK